MKDYVQLWLETLRDRCQDRVRHKDTVPARIEVVGQMNNHGDPNWVKAAVRMVVEPSDTFEVVDEVERVDALREFDHPDYIMIGLLSVLMTARYSPIFKVKITLKAVTIDPIETTRAAFEVAGRDAGRKIVAAMDRR
jgi:hypothetical protein